MEPLTTNSLCSISWKGLESLLSELQVPQLDLREFVLPPFNTHQLRPLLVARGIYPARDFPHLIARRLPDVFVTYDWRESVLAVRQTIGAALQHCVRPQTDAFPDARAQETEHKIGTVWDGIHAKKSNNTNSQTNFLFNFPLHGTPRRFVRVDLSAGKIPHIDVRPMAQQDARGVVEDDCKGANSVCARRH